MSMAAGRERRSTVSEAEFETAECCERTLRHLTRSFPLLNHPFTRVEVRGMGVRAVALQRIVNIQTVTHQPAATLALSATATQELPKPRWHVC